MGRISLGRGGLLVGERKQGITLGAGGWYEPEAQALFARFTTPPDTARKKAINDFWKTPGIKAIMAKFDGLIVMAAADSQAARRNWVADAFNPSTVNSPAFVADRGYTGNGTSSALLTGFNPATAGGKFTQNSAHMGVWSRTNLANGAAQSYDCGHATAYFGRGSAIPVRGRPNHNNDLTLTAAATFAGHSMWSRTASGAWAGYANGAPSASGTEASVAMTSSEFRLLSVTPTLFGVNQEAVFHWGGGLTAPEVATFYSALNAYMTAVGAA